MPYRLNRQTGSEGAVPVIGTYMFAAAALLIAGAVIGVLAVVTLGIHREERARSLTRDITDRAAGGARRLNGAYTRGLALTSEPARARHDT
jgi:hypothetical protein